MQATNLLEAFGAYRVRLAKRARSAMTPEGDLVISCWYAGFKKVQAEVLNYEEDLTGITGESTGGLRAHLKDALSSECGVRAIVAVTTPGRIVDEVESSARTSYYARTDLVGKVFSFSDDRFVVEFRRIPAPPSAAKAPKRAGRRGGSVL